MSDYAVEFSGGIEVAVSFAAPGPKGADGKSAYEIAVDNGFVGTEEQWLDDLAAGENGMASSVYDPQNVAGDAFDMANMSGQLSDSQVPESAVTQHESALTGKSDVGHSHTSANIGDFTEAVQDAVAAMLGEGSNISLSYDDENDELTITSTGGGSSDPEAIRDAIGVALVGVSPISISVDDPGNTITISTSATQNATDAALRDRATHTGEQAIATVTGLQAALDGKASQEDLDSNISDYLGAATLTSGAAISWDASTGKVQTLTLAHNATLTLSNLADGESARLDGTMGGSGSHTLGIAHAGLTLREMGGALADIAGLSAGTGFFTLSITRDGSNLRVSTQTLQT